MGRIRTIKPETPQSESLGRVSREARLTFLLLFTIADDDGRTRGNSQMVRSLLYPYDDDVTPPMVSDWLAELHRERCIHCYAVNGNSYVAICNWNLHQKIDKPTPSKLPPPPAEFADYSPNTPRAVADDSPADGNGMDGIGLDGNGEDHSSPAIAEGGCDSGESTTDSFELSKDPASKPRGYSAAFESWWLIYPKKVGKQAASSAYGRAVPKIAASRSCPSADAQTWLATVTRIFADSPAASDKQFVPDPERWLSKGRYDDDQSEWQRKRDVGSNGSAATGGYRGGGAHGSKAGGGTASKRFQGGGGN